MAIDCASAEAEVAAIRAKTIAAQKKQAAALEKVLASILFLQAVRRSAAVVRFAETTALERDRSEVKSLAIVHATRNEMQSDWVVRVRAKLRNSTVRPRVDWAT
jgi:hypothetical protein